MELETNIVDVVSSHIIDEKILREDASNWVRCIVARVAFSRRVIGLSRSKGARLKSLLGITTDGGDLLREFKSDSLVIGSSIRRSSILMLKSMISCIQRW